MSTISELWFASINMSLQTKLFVILVLLLVGFLIYGYAHKLSGKSDRARHRQSRRDSVDFFEMVSRFRDEIDYGDYYRSGRDNRYGYSPAPRSLLTLDQTFATVIR